MMGVSIEEMKNQSEIQNNEIESLLTNLMEVTSEKQQFESSYVEMKNSCESLSAENEAMHARVTEIDERNTDIELELEALKIEYRLLSERNNSLEEFEKSQAEKDIALAQYEEEVNDLSEQINTVFGFASLIVCSGLVYSKCTTDRQVFTKGV